MKWPHLDSLALVGNESSRVCSFSFGSTATQPIIVLGLLELILVSTIKPNSNQRSLMSALQMFHSGIEIAFPQDS